MCSTSLKEKYILTIELFSKSGNDLSQNTNVSKLTNFNFSIKDDFLKLKSIGLVSAEMFELITLFNMLV